MHEIDPLKLPHSTFMNSFKSASRPFDTRNIIFSFPLHHSTDCKSIIQ